MKPSKRTIAHHEAAHVAAHAFTGDEWEIESVSIRPNAYSLGRVTPEDTGNEP